METRTCFDLTTALENWRQELSARPALTADHLRELETHLRDGYAELQARGLNDEEAFWLARRRVGQPQALAAEFVKADPGQVWRERAFWIALGLLVLRLWNTLITVPLSSALVYTAHSRSQIENVLPSWLRHYTPDWILNVNYVVEINYFLLLSSWPLMAIFLVLLVRGKLTKFSQVGQFTQYLFQSRWRFAGLAFSMAVIATCFSDAIAYTSIMWLAHSTGGVVLPVPIARLCFQLMSFCCPIAIAAWLLPVPAPKPRLATI